MGTPAKPARPKIPAVTAIRTQPNVDYMYHYAEVAPVSFFAQPASPPVPPQEYAEAGDMKMPIIPFITGPGSGTL